MELRKSLLNAAALTSGAVVQGTTFIDGKGETAVLADYESYGPNNEVYLSKGQSITFALGSVDFADIQLGASLTGSAASTITVNGTTIQLDSATNLYYSIKNAIGTDKVVTITNTGDGMVALTNLRPPAVPPPSTSTPARLRWARYSQPCRCPARAISEKGVLQDEENLLQAPDRL